MALTEDQLNEATKNVLSVSNSLVSSVQQAGQNPLTSDKNKNLDNEKTNFDAIFNALPENAGDIRYVESYTEEEWADEANRLVVETVAKNAAKQLQTLFGTLEDTYANKAILDETSSFGAYAFPPPPKSYQILQVFTFETSAWNASVYIEVRLSTLEKTVSDAELYVFVSYQSIPGPLTKDHDRMYHWKNPNYPLYIFTPSNELYNRTGLFFVGIGQTSRTASNCVAYEPPTGIDTADWCFVKEFEFDFFARVLTKGCYYFHEQIGRFGNMNDTATQYFDDTIVECTTTHLTTFSVGLLNPAVDTEFTYKYISDYRKQNAYAAMIVFLLAVNMGVIIIFSIHYQILEVDKGSMYAIVDNISADLYHYAVVVETGYRMAAGTDSRKCILLGSLGISAMYECGRIILEKDHDNVGTATGSSSRIFIPDRFIGFPSMIGSEKALETER
ncbi:unnamed protein product [Nippostrongylus brasiliensis]|uniref:PKD_channel domain-containing protein n=1 Tax=Nippostrongylus brasiliensis TaxID=27835 RepID=A0A0N4XFR7_NIPBR|nr:unnamed protein product [Nippostrongylus brasiliensis]